MATTLRIATFNVLFGQPSAAADSWSARRTMLPRVVARMAPDVLGLQEVTTSMLDDVRRGCEGLALLPGPVTGPRRWANLTLPIHLALETVRTGRLTLRASARALRAERMASGEHQPIAYRAERFRSVRSGGFWISATPDRPSSMLPLAPSPFLVHWARFEALDGSGTLLFLNAHFGHAPWHHPLTVRVVSERIAALESEDGGAPALGTYLVGDFNAWPSSPLVRRLSAMPGFLDARRAARTRSGPPITYHWGVGNERFGLVLDHVIARSSLVPEHAEVIEVREGRLYPSDHHPMVVVFEGE